MLLPYNQRKNQKKNPKYNACMHAVCRASTQTPMQGIPARGPLLNTVLSMVLIWQNCHQCTTASIPFAQQPTSAFAITMQSSRSSSSSSSHSIDLQQQQQLRQLSTKQDSHKCRDRVRNSKSNPRLGWCRWYWQGVLSSSMTPQPLSSSR